MRLRLLNDRRHYLSIRDKLRQLSWGFVVLVCCVASIGFMMLYSAAHGDPDPWMNRQIVRFAIGLALMLFLALVDMQRLMRLAYPFYVLTFALLIYVEIAGEIGMGAQRWIDLKFIQLQPSELMKIALVMTLARYFHSMSYEEVGKPLNLVVPVLLVLAPAALVLIQPDLGTAGMLLLAAAALFFAAGVRWWKFAIVMAAGLAALPIAWGRLRDYQKDRILTFLDPESDALGAGYHITQSKIALGSGGLFGKGFLQGSQSHLDFLPERQTDFIFTMFAEEFGLMGSLLLLTLYCLLLLYGVSIALKARAQFGRLLAYGLTVNLFLYFFINTAMVMGLIPVVGVPLPLISYGGTAMITVMAGFGLMLSVAVNRDQRIGRHGNPADL